MLYQISTSRVSTLARTYAFGQMFYPLENKNLQNAQAKTMPTRCFCSFMLMLTFMHVPVTSGNAKGSARGQASPNYEPKVKTISLG